MKEKVVEYIKKLITDDDWTLIEIRDKNNVFVEAVKGGVRTPQISGKSQLYAYTKLFYYIFIKKICKDCNKT